MNPSQVGIVLVNPAPRIRVNDHLKAVNQERQSGEDGSHGEGGTARLNASSTELMLPQHRQKQPPAFIPRFKGHEIMGARWKGCMLLLEAQHERDWITFLHMCLYSAIGLARERGYYYGAQDEKLSNKFSISTRFSSFVLLASSHHLSCE